MTYRAIVFTLAVVFGLQIASVGDSWAHDKFKNLKVLKDNGKSLEKGMKELSKGLGVKCKACHVKGEFESDKVAAKVAARDFLKKVIVEKDQAKRDEALTALLKALKIDTAKKPDKIWSGLTRFQKI